MYEHRLFGASSGRLRAYPSEGSHRRYRHPDGRKVTLAFHHASDTLPLPTLRMLIERQAQWSEEDLKRLGLLKYGTSLTMKGGFSSLAAHDFSFRYAIPPQTATFGPLRISRNRI